MFSVLTFHRFPVLNASFIFFFILFSFSFNSFNIIINDHERTHVLILCLSFFSPRHSLLLHIMLYSFLVIQSIDFYYFTLTTVCFSFFFFFLFFFYLAIFIITYCCYTTSFFLVSVYIANCSLYLTFINLLYQRQCYNNILNKIMANNIIK